MLDMDAKRGLLFENEARTLEAWAHAFVNEPLLDAENWVKGTKHKNLAYQLWVHIELEIDPHPRWYARALWPLYGFDAPKSWGKLSSLMQRKNPGWDKKAPYELVQQTIRDLPPDDPEVPEWHNHHMLSRMVREVREDIWDTAKIYRRGGMLKQCVDLQIHQPGKYLDRNTIRRRLDND
jgi:hypothetical protein